MLGTEEREEEREGQACAREEGHDSWKVLGIKIACLCECVAQRTLYGREDGARVNTGEGRVAYVLEEAKVVVGSHGDEIESRRGEVDRQDEGTTYTEVSSFCGKKRNGSLTVAPTTVEGVEELVSKENDEYPDGPGYDVGNGAQDPVATRTRYSGGVRIGESRHSADVNRNEPKVGKKKKRQLTRSK